MYDGSRSILLIISLSSASDGCRTMTPELSRSEWRRLAQKPGHWNASSMLRTTSVSASKNTTERHEPVVR